jgi:oligopeptide transport system permease protein
MDTKQISLSTWRWKIFCQNTSALVGLCFLFLLCLFAIVGPFISSYPYDEIHLSAKNMAPCRQFWFGTDELGRDLFTRIWWGARISLFVGISAASLDLLIGVLYGAVAALSHPKVEECLMRIADILYSIPYLLIVILLMVILGPGLTSLMIALTLTGWIGMARITRSEIRRLRTMEFVQASKALGASKSHIIIKHLLPNCIGQIFVTLMLTIPSAIFTEAFLSFLGLGVQAPIASWGSMASDGLSALKPYPWRLFFPAGFISFTLLCFHLVGEGLRNAFDPRTNR